MFPCTIFSQSARATLSNGCLGLSSGEGRSELPAPTRRCQKRADHHGPRARMPKESRSPRPPRREDKHSNSSICRQETLSTETFLADVAERQHWDDYMAAYEEAISATSTDHAPWYVVPADKKWVSRAVVAAVLAGTIRNLGLEWPKIDDTKRRQIDEARRLLEAE